MNKFNKDQKQKIFLSILLMIGLVYGYFNFLLAPLSRSEAGSRIAIETLDKQLAKAGTAVKRSKVLQDQAQSAQEMLAQVSDMIPDGAAIAWFPPRIRAFFDRHALKGAVVRPGSIDGAADAALHNFRTADWTIDLPEAGIVPLGIALAGLENEEKLLEITRLQISTAPDSPEKQHVTINATTLLK